MNVFKVTLEPEECPKYLLYLGTLETPAEWWPNEYKLTTESDIDKVEQIPYVRKVELIK